MLRVLSLFAGIGGFDLGLERTGGFKTVAFCEIEPFAVRVLNKHWPEVPVYGDVRQLTADRLRADGIVPDVICGGFPCQDISDAGARAGIEGERSGLWAEIARLTCELRPRFVIVENVAALLSRGLGKVLGDLAEIGYDAEWNCIPASAVGAPHRRDRLWLVAYPNAVGCGSGRRPEPEYKAPANFNGKPPEDQQQWRGRLDWSGAVGATLSNTKGKRLEKQRLPAEGRQVVAEPTRRGRSGKDASGALWHWWAVEPALGRVAHGVPDRVDRLRALGNAVVPQIPELIGRAILASLAEHRRAA